MSFFETLLMVESHFDSIQHPTPSDFALVFNTDEVKKRAKIEWEDRESILLEQTLVKAQGRMFSRLESQGAVKRDQIVSEFCAKYLPVIIDGFLKLLPPKPNDNPTEEDKHRQDFELQNTFFKQLVFCQSNPYFVKYFRSQKEAGKNNRRFVQTVADRFLRFAIRWNWKLIHYEDDPTTPCSCVEDLIMESLQFFSTLLMVYSKDKDRTGLLYESTKTRFLQLLRPWSHHVSKANPEFAEYASRVRSFLEEKEGFLEVAQRVRKGYKRWDVCALPSCDKTSGLRACGKFVDQFPSGCILLTDIMLFSLTDVKRLYT
ncbi:hypothetical protein CC1G_01032 [Coprinopsis cinerea okayama7|uniref:Uncharacterized protein n=1 Tax=Coprinopsis cinerea (strain Okayama-7 / 130 / ATCC MYA-4618 / FGSC 9003) TaxID=240176 RepID=A8NEA3_COPC7|nr:hypothetical protein CC1G_01032 [Coprinopsis cinerea okayama7\|eukprot:XP_001832970.2 hypothetical protein CC1G_01032 [Coprinopsis cinerea okayama7\